MPVSQGELQPGEPAAILDGERPVPSQYRVTAHWPDGSAKWILFRFQADLPANESKSLQVALGKEPGSSPETCVTVQPQAGSVVADTGVLKLELGPGPLFQSIHLGGEALTHALLGPLVTRSGCENEQPMMAAVDETGWIVEEAGPVEAVLSASGRHFSSAEDDGGFLDFRVRLHLYAGKPWVRMDYKLLNREEEAVRLGEVGLRFRPESAGTVRYALATSNYRSRIEVGNGSDPVEYTIDADHLVYQANEQIPETHYGTFWCDWAVEDRVGMSMTLYQAYQNFPKALRASREGLDAWLVPQGHEVALAQGMAKTHSVFLHFHDGSTDLDVVNVRSLQFDLPDQCTLSPEVYRDTALFEGLEFPPDNPAVERLLTDMADQRTRAYGILHWGDGPDANYTHQGRGRGELVWTNNEYDLPHAAMMLYAHTGLRRMLDYLLVAARHWMDVDVCHLSDDPLRHQGQVVHSADHVSGGVTVSHEWVEGLLHYFHQTGDPFAFETAVGIGKNVLRHLEQPRLQELAGSAARETGWALRTLVALFRETHDTQWLVPADRIVDQFAAWQEAYGAWLAPYTDHTLARVPFMIAIAANSLMRYYRLFPKRKVGTMIVRSMEDLIEHCLLADGRFYYKELPSLQRGTTLVLLLESLAYAYEITDDKRFLEAGLPTFSLILRQGAGGGGGQKEAVGDAVVVRGGPGPKTLAMNAPPIMAFCQALYQADMWQSQTF